MGRNLTERAQDIFLTPCLRLLVGEDVAGRATRRAQAKDVLPAERCDRSFEDGGAGGPDAYLLRYLASQWRIHPLVHQGQGSANAVVGNEAEERRLLQLDCEPLS